MATTKEGGAAFPVACPNGTMRNEGMTLRDAFAIEAIGGYLSNSNCRGTFTDLAKDAYSMADAMLAERSKP